MVIRQHPLNTLRVDSSIFGTALPKTVELTPSLVRSLKENGQLQPLLVWEKNGELHLLDGFQRYYALHGLQVSEVTVQLLPAEFSSDQLATLLLQTHHQEINSSVMARARFLNGIVQLGITPARITENWLPELGFQAHDSLWRKLDRINSLPEMLQRFGEEKGFSLKQLHQLTRHPPELLEWILLYSDRLALTASILEQILQGLKDLTLRQKKPLQSPELLKILANDHSPQDRTRLLREWLKEQCFPILNQHNEKIRHHIGALDLPKIVVCQWDQTLERQELMMKIQIRNSSEWPEITKHLQHPQIENELAAILELM